MAVFDAPITTSDQSMDRVLAAGLPVALIFIEGQPSPDLEAAMKRAARENAGDVLVVKIQAKENPKATQRYQIARTPAVVTIKGNQVLTKAELTTDLSADFTDFATVLEEHLAYLLGEGPEPQAPSASRQQSRAAARTAAVGRPKTVTDASFEGEVIRAAQPVLVDFWAPWCGPCRMTEPIIEKLAGEMAGRLKVAKVNVDENPHTAQRYGVQSIPTMMIVKDGRIVDQWAGALPEAALRNRVLAKI